MLNIIHIIQDVALEFDFGNNNSTGQEGLGQSRLQKAIERNRAKQSRRSMGDRSSTQEDLDLSAASSRMNRRDPLGSERRGLPKKSRHLPGERPNFNRADRDKAQDIRQKSAPGRSTLRKAVANADNVEFATSVKRSIRRPPAQANYSTIKSKSRPIRKKVPGILDRKSKIMVKCLWGFLGLLCLRLIFSGGGVIDYYTNKNLLSAKELEYESTKRDNIRLAKEIKKIKSNKKYQKKLVRDHLGFIAADEFVILFPKEKS